MVKLTLLRQNDKSSILPDNIIEPSIFQDNDYKSLNLKYKYGHKTSSDNLIIQLEKYPNIKISRIN
jgi:hypothetical protein